MMPVADREVIGRFESPDGRWAVEILAPIHELDPFFPCVFEASRDRTGWEHRMGCPFGYCAPSDQVQIRWDLPGDAMGAFVNGECYAIFRTGRHGRRNRELFHTGKERALSPEEIARFTRPA